MEVRKSKLLFESVYTKQYSTTDPGQIIVRYKDELVRTKKKGPLKIKSKGTHDWAIASALFSYLEGYHIPTHFIKSNKATEILIKPSEPIPIEMVIWNFAVDSLSQRYGLKTETPLSCAVVEYFLKAGKLKNPMIHFDHACALEIVTLEEMKGIDQFARKANAVLKSFFERRELKLYYFTLEFGRCDDQILLAGDLSPNTLHLWDTRNTGFPQEILGEDASEYDSEYQQLKDRICK